MSAYATTCIMFNACGPKVAALPGGILENRGDAALRPPQVLYNASFVL